MKNFKKNFFGYAAIVLTLVMVTATAFAFAQPSAGAETVTISENVTIVTSPFTDAVKKVHGSVVGVNNYTVQTSNSYNYSNPFGNFGFSFGYGNPYGNPYGGETESKEVLQGSGSGVVVAKGYVLTNYHVIEDASRLEVVIDEQTYPAQLMGTEEATDLAVLYVENLEAEPVVLGDSDALLIGDWAICIGNPLGFTGTTTVGVVSALNREVAGNATDAYGKRATNLMIQTDAAINSGNSGGGMFNVAGELIGIPSLKYSSSTTSGASIEGIGMAIPVNVAKPLIEDVINGRGNVQSTPNQEGITTSGKPRMGVSVSNTNSSHYFFSQGLLPSGVYVSEVEAGSPAEKAGIQVADIIVEIDGEIMKNITQMTTYLQSKQPGYVAQVKLYRVDGGLNNVEGTDLPGGQYIDVQVTLELLDEVQQ